MESIFDEKKAAHDLGCSVGLLRKWRLSGEGPAFCRIGRLVRYRGEDLAAFLAANRVEGRA
jgi:Helix-turn-helix domain